MQDIKQDVSSAVSRAIAAAFEEDGANVDPIIQVATRAEFGDYQSNFAMALSKTLRRKPRELAEAVVGFLQQEPLFEEITIAGPGFINLTLANSYLQTQLQTVLSDPRLGVSKTSEPQTVVVDYGSANVAKEMHVGHIRSTVIGDAIVRILGFLGHDVIRQNHVGDWGTQFGMLIEHLLDNNWQADSEHSIGDLNALYKTAKVRFDNEADFTTRARERVVLLQKGDEATLAIWQQIVDESERYFGAIFERLDVLLEHEDIRGESFYNPMLADVVRDLQEMGVASTSDGASVVFLDGFVDRDKTPLPYMIQKSDGGFLYATSDVAAAKYRIDTLKANRLIYVTDVRQSQHFAMLFATLRKAEWATDAIRLEHVPFGSILGKDRKPYKTRSGDTIKLADVIDEAEKRALQAGAEKNASLPEEERKSIAHHVGIGAIKYADLCSDKVKDYVFDWDQMLSFEGNTAPYLQNAYVRIQSIFRKGEIQPHHLANKALKIMEPAEHRLAVKLLAFSSLIEDISENLSLHRMCGYLHELASNFHHFYEKCPVLSAPDEATKHSRLLLCKLVAETIALGLSLIGITVLQRM